MTIAFYQQNILWEEPQGNYERVEQAFRDAVDRHQSPVDLLVVPETFSTGFSDNMAALSEAPEGATFQFALRMAQQFDALFVGTWTVRDPADGRVYNRMHWVRPDGTYGIYDKAHTFRMSSEASQLARGERRATFTWRGWRIRPAICYDLRFPGWLRNHLIDEEGAPLPKEALRQVPLSLKSLEDHLDFRLDYDLLLVCANWPGSRHEAWSTLLRARAIENLSYVVGTNRVGTDGVGIPYEGCSAAIDFKGQPLALCQPGADQVQMVSLDREALLRFRRHWPFYLDSDMDGRGATLS